jgi:hypothetical protein
MTTANTVTDNAQPNITSVGTLTSLIVGNSTANSIFGNGSIVTSGVSGNITGVNVVSLSTIVSSTGSNGNITLDPDGTGVVSVIGDANISSNLTVNNITANGNVSFVTGSTVTFANVANLKIPSGTGTNGYYLQTDGNSNLTWARATVSISSVSYGNTNINIAGRDGNIVLTANSGSGNVGVLTVANTGGVVVVGNLDVGINYLKGNGYYLSNVQATNITGTIANATYAVNAGNAYSVTWSNISSKPTTISGFGITDSYSNTNVAGYLSTYTGTIANANYALYAGTAGYASSTGLATSASTVISPNQPNITSLGTLTSLTVGNATANLVFGNGTIDSSGIANFGGLNITGNSNLGSNSFVKITGGQPTFVLSTTDGLGNLAWVQQTSGGSGSYSNSDVANYLPTYTGRLTASNANITNTLTASNINISTSINSTTLTNYYLLTFIKTISIIESMMVGVSSLTAILMCYYVQMSMVCHRSKTMR